MDLIADRGRRVTVDELNTTPPAGARPQAGGAAQVRRHADRRRRRASLRERAHVDEILPVHGERRAPAARDGRPRQAAAAASCRRRRRLTRTWAAASRAIRCARPRRPSKGQHRDVQLGHRWMDAMSVDYSCLFPTGMLNIGLHPQKEMEVELCWAYNRWLTEKVLPESDGRFYLDAVPAVLAIPTRALRQVETFGDRKGVGGFMVTTVRNQPVQRQRLHEGLSRDGGARPGAVVPLRPELGGAGVQEPATASSRCTRSASRSTTSCTAPTGSSTAWASASRSCR